MLTRAGIGFMHVLARLPLPWVRALGWILGAFLYVVVVPRRRVVLVNLRLCFPGRSEAERRWMAWRSFICFAQAWLDRGWLWHAPRPVLERRLRLVGDVEALAQRRPAIVFGPHFYGLDAGGTAILMQVHRPATTIYTPQSNQGLNDWINAGRTRIGQVQVLRREQGVKAIVQSLRQDGMLYLLADMNFGPEESVFVPFYGVQAATVPSLSRFARLGRAVVVPVTTRMTPEGYEAEVHPAWTDFPTDDVMADTARMNRWLERVIDTMPEQYYWVHKRFKTRPPGEPDVYRP